MKLLLDLGNTRLKWALSSISGDWTAQGALQWGEAWQAALASAWEGLASPSMIVVASVVDVAREEAVAAVLGRSFDGPVTWLRTPAEACGVSNAYAQPERLGVDRFLAMVAAHAEGRGACVLASIGTALTLDALAVDGRHFGGWIAPGPSLMQRSLLEGTARVGLQQDGAVVDLADNTTDAVVSGCWHASAALIERFVTRLRPRLGGSPALLVDGGDATRLLPLLAMPAEQVSDSVLRGLAVWANTHPAPPAPD
jgi:type III pantothenate kinase